MITEEDADRFAHDWIEAWNTHDLDRIMRHYAEDVEYFSPFAARLTDDKTGMLRGRDSVREYLAKGLAAYPDLHFRLLHLFVGVRSLTLHYQSVNDMVAAEVFELDDQGLVVRVQCHYLQV